jgi:hypothetical protein
MGAGLHVAAYYLEGEAHIGQTATGVLILAVALAAAGVNMAVCLVVLTVAPLVTVVGYETLGHRHMADALERL